MLDVDRLRGWARNIAAHGADISQWGSVSFVQGELERMADGLEETVHDVGKLRAALTAASEREAALREDLDHANTAVLETAAMLNEKDAEITRLTALAEERRKDALHHADCRPNQQQAQQAMADAKATNDLWANEVQKVRALREAGKALVAALDACKSNIDSAFLISGVHGIEYDGPTYGVELEALRGLITEPTP